MNAKQTAMQYADFVLALVPQLIHQAVEERRQHACWYEAYRRRRLALCRPAFRWYWRALLRRSQAMCAANREMAQACALASARVRMDGLAVCLFALLGLVACVVDDVPAECDDVWPDCEGIGNACIHGACVSVSLECDSAEVCPAGYVCGDTRACSLPCDDRAGCQGGLVCRPELGYCSDPCDSDDDCDLVPGAVCDPSNGALLDQLDISEAWDIYDEWTLPARVALLRELAAELRVEGHNSGHWTDEKVVSSICAEMERRADALEAGK